MRVREVIGDADDAPRRAVRATEAETAVKAVKAVKAGSWVSWRASGAAARGRVTSVHTASTVPGVQVKVVGTAQAPAARVMAYERSGDGWKPSGSYVAAPVADLSIIDELAAPTGPTTEAIGGRRSANDTRALLCDALEARMRALTGDKYVYVYVRDFTDADVVYSAGSYDDLWQANYSVDAAGAVTFGEPTAVVEQTVFLPAPDIPEAEPVAVVREARDRISGRVVEAKGADETGGRVFRVRIIEYGDSANRRRYPAAVVRAAAAMYEGAKAYDHHRTDAELRSSTIAGLVGTYRDVEAAADGLYADMHLLPSATHAAEALDASLAAQEAGLAPLVGISHDVLATYKPVVDGGARLEEATAIVKVNSADVVADPAAGGKPTRVVAGGGGDRPDDRIDPAGTAPAAQSAKESDVPVTKTDVLAALKDATDDELAAVGLSKADTSTTDAPAGATNTAETATEAMAKTSFLGGLMVERKVEAAGLPPAVAAELAKALPEQITESIVDAQITALQAGLGVVERAGLLGGGVRLGAQVTQESRDKKVAALDAFFAGTYRDGYRSFREAFVDFTGYRARAWGEDLNRHILRECFGAGFDSAVRLSESLDSSSWAQVLGDSVTRRMIAMYGQPSLQTWRKVVSDTPPITDFRQQKRARVGGYGTLPVVNQGAPYQPLPSPGDEEAVYQVIKRGGTDDLTLEMIANDDIAAIRNVPRLLGLAAAITLYRFVWDIFPTNAATSYDATALFHANHANTDNPAVLGQSTLSAGRRKMRQQAAFGDTANILSLRPRLVIVPSALEEIGFQLVTSAVAIPATPAGPSDTPNIHAGMDLEVVDYWTDGNDWFLAADPAMCPLVEVGFYQGREDPELFTQADQNTGSMFNADKFTYKIRHIYSGTPLDHRGFYRGSN